MRTRFLPFLLIALSLGLGASAARAATSPYAGKYFFVVMNTGGSANNRDASSGTCTVSSTGSVSITVTRQVTGNTKIDPIGKTHTLHGSVSADGKLSLTDLQSVLNVKFITNGSIVTGLQGTFSPKPGSSNSDSGLVLGLKQS